MTTSGLGETVGDGQWTLVEHLHGGDERGVYRGRDAEGAPVRVSLTTPLRVEAKSLGHALRLPAPGVAPLRWLGPVIISGRARAAMVEDEPAGTPLAAFVGEARPDLVPAVARGTAAIVQRLHAAGLVALGLRPETIYVDGDRVTGLAPRGEALYAVATPLGRGAPPPYARLYRAPEVLGRERHTPASDVFALAAILAHLATGEHPFDGESASAQLLAICGGRRRRTWAPVEAALAADPATRPSLADLVAAVC